MEKHWLEQNRQKKEKKHALLGYSVAFLDLFNHGGWDKMDCIKSGVMLGIKVPDAVQEQS